MQLTNIQKAAVEKILNSFSNGDRIVDFKSPTGSGKTLMASYLISSIIERYPEDSFVFVIATPSSSSLPYFFEQKLNLYKKDLPYSKFDVQYIESPSSSKEDKTEQTPKLLPEVSKVYIFGKSTFGRGRIFTERNVIEDFVSIIADKNYKLIYIRDEAHIGGYVINDQETLRFEDLMRTTSTFTLNMTATPDYNADSTKIIIREADLNDIRLNDDKWLIKTNLVPLLNRDISDENLLDDAIENFKLIKSEYQKLEESMVYIRPAMLIQVDNEPSTSDKKTTFNESLHKIKDKLTSNGLAWVQYFGDNNKDSNRVYKGNFSLDDITKNDNDIDVIIFKIGPSTGWDIPRACLLLQLRNVSSSTLNTQTIGRIKRNPYPNLSKHPITDNYYVYSNAPTIDDDIVIYNYNVKNHLVNHELAVINIGNKAEIKAKEQFSKTKTELFDLLQSRKDEIIQLIKSLFIQNESGNDIFKRERSISNNHVVYTEVKNVFMLLKDIEILKEKNGHIFPKYSEVFTKLWMNEMQHIRIYDDIRVTQDHLNLVILKYYIKDIDNIIKRNIPFIPEFKIELQRYEPKHYVQVYDGSIRQSSIERFSNYLFDIKRNNDTAMNQPLDSRPEEVVFNELCLEMYRLDKLVTMWAKNMVFSNISGEYIDDNQNFRKSYFDFVIKFSNGSFLYIEVKSDDDIDPVKTELLERAYSNYFSKKMISIFDYLVVIIVVKVSGNLIVQKPFYDKGVIGVQLENLSLRDLLSTLASINEVK